MFEFINTKELDKESVALSRPNEVIIKEVEDDKADYYTILKGASKYLYKQLELSASTSKEVYKLSEPIWKNLIDHQLNGTEEKPSNLNLAQDEFRYIVDSYHNLIDMGYLSEDANNIFVDKMEKFIMEVSSMEHTAKIPVECSGGLLKLVIYRADANIVDADYTPVILLEMNNKKAQYDVFTGILLYNGGKYIFVPTMQSLMNFESYINFIMDFDILNSLELAEKDAKRLYDVYMDCRDSKIEISARELIRILKSAGYKLELKEDMSLDDIAKLNDEESNKSIKDFFNTFVAKTGETAEDILNLSEIKKVFKYNKLTIVDLLIILSKEYLDSEGGSKITASMLSDLVYSLYTRRTDKVDAKGIIDDINND